MIDLADEEVIDPSRAIIDPHHHLWLETAQSLAARSEANPYAHVRRTVPRYLFDDVLADLSDGHRIVATVYAECGSMYRAGGAPEMRSVGEVEFANGAAAMFASGRFGISQVAPALSVMLTCAPATRCMPCWRP